MNARPSGLRLLPKDALIPTSEVDHPEWLYEGLLGWLQRKRFELLLALMGDAHYGRLLEVGYGSGVLMPELAARCDELFGVDPHPRQREVGEVLSAHGVGATLRSASATELPFEDASLDCVVSVSALEYIGDIHRAGAEIERALVPGGVFVFVTPGHSALLDLAARLTTGEDPVAHYGKRRQRVIPALLERFGVAEDRVFPAAVGRAFPIYRALRLLRR
jgi:SAM-dependent methyltransferase